MKKHMLKRCGFCIRSCYRDMTRLAGLLTVFMAAVFAIMPLTALADMAQTVTEGVYVEDMNVGGMTEAELRTAVEWKAAQVGDTMAMLKIGEQTVSMSLSSLGLRWSNQEIIEEIMQLGTTGNIITRYKNQKDLEYSTVNYSLTFSVDQAAAQAVAESCSAYNTEPVEAEIYTTDELTPGIRGGTDGITVNVAGAAAAIEDALNAWDGSSAVEIELPVTTKKPDLSYDDLSLISDVLGQATTDYSSSSWERATNVENGCSKITGTLLYPGDYFSVTDAVTPFSAENGYQPAPSYEENRVVDSYGGGICQVSTTLYNAVLKAELEVVSRSNHTMAVSYVDLSKDAAIAEGNMDFAFVNSLDDPIYIVGYTSGGTITFIIYGHETRPSNRTIEFVSETISVVEPTSAKLYANTSQPVGYVSQTQSPHTGYTAELWKNIYYDGVLSDTVQINSSYYDAVGTIYDVGVASTNTALTTAMYNAISMQSLSQVQAVIASAYSYTTAATDTTGTGTDTTGTGTTDTTTTDTTVQVTG